MLPFIGRAGGLSLFRSVYIPDSAITMNTEEPPEEKSGRSEADARKRKAACPDLPRDALRRLEDDEDAPVRAAVAGNSNAPPEMLGRLAEDDAPEVRKNVATNESAPLSVLERLLVDWKGASKVAAPTPRCQRKPKGGSSAPERKRICRRLST